MDNMTRHNAAVALTGMTGQITFPHQIDEIAKQYGIKLEEFGADEDDTLEQLEYGQDCHNGIEPIDYIDYYTK